MTIRKRKRERKRRLFPTSDTTLRYECFNGIWFQISFFVLAILYIWTFSNLFFSFSFFSSMNLLKHTFAHRVVFFVCVGGLGCCKRWPHSPLFSKFCGQILTMIYENLLGINGFFHLNFNFSFWHNKIGFALWSIGHTGYHLLLLKIFIPKIFFPTILSGQLLWSQYKLIRTFEWRMIVDFFHNGERHW